MNSKGLAKQDYLALLLLLISLLWFDRELISTNQVPFFRDLGPFFYPMRYLLAESFKAWELPLWDRHTAMGFPLFANFQSGALYPPNFLFALLPFFGAVKAVFYLHYLIAISGTYLLCRHWKYPPYLAVIGALLFTLGGTIVSLSNLLNHFQTAIWLPWLILLGERAFLDGSRRNVLAFTGVSLIQFLAGSPELYAMSVGLLLFDALRLKTQDKPFPYARSFRILVAANVLAIGLAMVQVLPTAELFLESRGPKPLSYEVAATWSLRPVSLIDVVFPYGEVDTSIFSGTRFFFLNDFPLIVSHYLGMIALFGLCLWCFVGSAKEKAVFLGIFVASLILAFGSYTPVYPWLYKFIPLFKLFRFPEKFFFITHALVVFAVLRGLFTFIHDGAPPPRGTVAALSSLTALISLVYLFTRLDSDSASRFIAWITQTPLYFSPMVKSASGALFYLERQAALSVGLLLLLVLHKRQKVGAVLFQGLMVALVFIDLSTANRPYRYLLDPEFVFHGNKTITEHDPEPYRLFYYPQPNNVHPNYYVVREGQSFATLNSLITENLLPNTGVFQGFDYMQELDALRRWPYRVFIDVANKLPPERQYHLLKAFNVKYIMSLAEPPAGEISLVRHFPQYPSWVYRLDQTVPRAYTVGKAVEEKDPALVLEHLSRLDFDPTQEVVIEEGLATTANGNFQSETKIVHYSDRSATIRASLNAPGLLVLADSYYPGWRAFVDGKEERILRANLFFRAVSLGVGEHTVEFRYQPLSFTVGWIVSLFTFGAIVFWVVFYDRFRARFSV